MLITTFKICAFITGILGCTLVSLVLLKDIPRQYYYVKEAFKKWEE